VRIQIRVVAAALAACACGSQVAPTLSLSFAARPAAIDDRGQRSLLSFAVADDQGVPVDGTVTVTAAAGLLSLTTGTGDAGVLAVGLDDAGTAVLGFTCRRALDVDCQGSVRLVAEWRRGDQYLVQVKRLTINATDGGL